MKKYINCFMLMLFLTFAPESIAQSYYRIVYPYITEATDNNVYIKSIEFTEHQTRIDFIACHSGHYIYLEKPGQRNAMYIKIGNRRYKLRSTHGIASTNGGTYCQPGQLLEFTAIFEPIPDKERDNFDLIEGIDGTWNFYKVSISKYLSKEKVPDWVSIDNHKGNMANFKEETIEYPYVERQSHPYLIMMKIERLTEHTIIHFWYKTPYENSSWMNFNENTCLQTLDGKQYYVQSSTGIPLSPKVYNFNKLGQSVTFSLTFPALPDDVDCFSLYELVLDGFTFYNVKLRSDFNGYIDKCDKMEKFFKSITPDTSTNNVKNVKKQVRNKLKKNPNFKIE